jgi:hypothetical protein
MSASGGVRAPIRGDLLRCPRRRVAGRQPPPASPPALAEDTRLRSGRISSVTCTGWAWRRGSPPFATQPKLTNPIKQLKLLS